MKKERPSAGRCVGRGLNVRALALRVVERLGLLLCRAPGTEACAGLMPEHQRAKGKKQAAIHDRWKTAII